MKKNVEWIAQRELREAWAELQGRLEQVEGYYGKRLATAGEALALQGLPFTFHIETQAGEGHHRNQRVWIFRGGFLPGRDGTTAWYAVVGAQVPPSDGSWRMGMGGAFLQPGLPPVELLEEAAEDVVAYLRREAVGILSPLVGLPQEVIEDVLPRHPNEYAGIYAFRQGFLMRRPLPLVYLDVPYMGTVLASPFGAKCVLSRPRTFLVRQLGKNPAQLWRANPQEAWKRLAK